MVALMLQYCVRLSCNVCIVAKRCVLTKNCLRSNRKWPMGNKKKLKPDKFFMGKPSQNYKMVARLVTSRDPER